MSLGSATGGVSAVPRRHPPRARSLPDRLRACRSRRSACSRCLSGKPEQAVDVDMRLEMGGERVERLLDPRLVAETGTPSRRAARSTPRAGDRRRRSHGHRSRPHGHCAIPRRRGGHPESGSAAFQLPARSSAPYASHSPSEAYHRRSSRQRPRSAISRRRSRCRARAVQGRAQWRERLRYRAGRRCCGPSI